MGKEMCLDGRKLNTIGGSCCVRGIQPERPFGAARLGHGSALNTPISRTVWIQIQLLTPKQARGIVGMVLVGIMVILVTSLGLIPLSEITSAIAYVLVGAFAYSMWLVVGDDWKAWVKKTRIQRKTIQRTGPELIFKIKSLYSVLFMVIGGFVILVGQFVLLPYLTPPPSPFNPQHPFQIVLHENFSWFAYFVMAIGLFLIVAFGYYLAVAFLAWVDAKQEN
jgi:hypothetical protein